MRLLIDSHIFLIVAGRKLDRLPAAYLRTLLDGRNILYLSAASLWEIALKWRTGKLPLGVPPDDLPHVANDLGISLVAVNPEHAVHRLEPLPATKDPFDRMLLAQCRVESLQLVTFDRQLVDHPLAWTPASA